MEFYGFEIKPYSTCPQFFHQFFCKFLNQSFLLNFTYKIHLPVKQPKPLVERIENLEIQMQEVETLLAGKNVLNLTYEDDIEQDPQSAYHSICKFVNMEATKASVTLSKTNPFPLKDVIENFAEVKATLHNTPYEWMIVRPNS